MIGRESPVPVRVPEITRTQLGHDLADLRGLEVELTGTLTAGDGPLELVLDRAAAD